MGCVFDVSQEVLNTDLLSFRSADAALAMNKLTHKVTVLVDFLSSEERLCGKSNLLFLLDIANNKNWVRVVAPQNFVDLDV